MVVGDNQTFFLFHPIYKFYSYYEGGCQKLVEGDIRKISSGLGF